MSKEYLEGVMSTEEESEYSFLKSAPLLFRPVWKICSESLKLRVSWRAETAAGSELHIGQCCLYSLYIGHPVYPGSKKCSMDISSVTRGLSCPVELLAGRRHCARGVHIPQSQWDIFSSRNAPLCCLPVLQLLTGKFFMRNCQNFSKGKHYCCQVTVLKDKTKP